MGGGGTLRIFFRKTDMTNKCSLWKPKMDMKQGARVFFQSCVFNSVCVPLRMCENSIIPFHKCMDRAVGTRRVEQTCMRCLIHATGRIHPCGVKKGARLLILNASNFSWTPHSFIFQLNYHSFRCTNCLFRVLVFSQGKGGLVGHSNPMGLSSLGSKSPNLQSPPNVSVSKDLMGGMHPQLMPNTSHPNQLHSTMPMSSIQGGMNVTNVGGNMIVTNSNMGGAGMLGSGIINNVNKQLPTMMANNHHGGPQHHPHAQVSFSNTTICKTLKYDTKKCL